MTRFPTILIAVAVLALLATRGQAADKKGGLAEATPGKTYYTQSSLFWEDDHHYTTNYRKGSLLPVNSEIEYVKARGTELTIKIKEYNKVIVLKNEEKYSGQKLDGIWNRYFSEKRVDLSKFTEKEKKNIETGQVDIGMSKDAVLVALGYPPSHQTPSLKMDNWRYWKNRFATMLVTFDNDKVSNIK